MHTYSLLTPYPILCTDTLNIHMLRQNLDTWSPVAKALSLHPTHFLQWATSKVTEILEDVLFPKFTHCG